ncbi:hypothetical protein GCM10018780_81790 [Streptomyces lanatus]|nr:hypothetical protein GCM10018780_81790 [Streptomyces lanatus]
MFSLVRATLRQASGWHWGVVSESFEGSLAGSFTKGLGRVVDVGDVGAGMDRGVVPVHDPSESAVVEDDGALEAGSLFELLQAAGASAAAGPARRLCSWASITVRRCSPRARACSLSTSARKPESAGA